MLRNILLLLFACQQISLGIPVTKINNAIFNPMDSNYWLANLSNIVSCDQCICQCYGRSTCATANYYGSRQECILFSASLRRDQLHVMPISENTTVIGFENRSYVEVATTESSNTITTTVPTIATTYSTNSTHTTVATTYLTNSTHTAVPTTYSTNSLLTAASNYSCTSAPNNFMTYTTLPSAYQKQVFNYTALSTGIATLEFGFMAKNSPHTWHLDDVSIRDLMALNIEMLLNGDFENGTLIGWQVFCSAINCGGPGGVIARPPLCYTGSYCYQGACMGAYDFLRQSFAIIAGHVYTLSFWLLSDGHNQQAAYVTIRE